MELYKSQGLTITSGVVDIGDCIFANGQTYVAFSRLKIYIISFFNLNPKSIKINDGAIIEFNRLRSKLEKIYNTWLVITKKYKCF